MLLKLYVWLTFCDQDLVHGDGDAHTSNSRRMRSLGEFRILNLPVVMLAKQFWLAAE